MPRGAEPRHPDRRSGSCPGARPPRPAPRHRFLRNRDPDQDDVPGRRRRQPHLLLGLRRDGVARPGGLYAIAGFALANLTTAGNGKGLNLGWAPARHPRRDRHCGPRRLRLRRPGHRSYGIYFLMITLAFAVIVNFFFGQVTSCRASAGSATSRSPGSSTPATTLTASSTRRCTWRRSSTRGCGTSRAPRSG